jgi:urea transport system permease protein
MFRLNVIAALMVALAAVRPGFATTEERQTLIKAVLSEDAAEQNGLLQKLIGSSDAMVAQGLTAWRGGTLYLFETNGAKIPFLLDSQIDSNGAARGIKVIDGANLTEGAGKAALFVATDLTAADTNSKLRKAIKTVLDLFALGNENPKMRRDAVIKLGQDQNAEYLPILEGRLGSEKNTEVRKALNEAIALTQIASEDAKARVEAIQRLGKMRSINAVSFLETLKADAAKNKAKYGAETFEAADLAVSEIQNYMWWGNLFGTAFRGVSLAAVLLVAALGLAITFGLMGVINMAHGEIIAVGAYTAFVTQNVFARWMGPNSAGFYFLPGLAAAFVTAAMVGIILERGIIRFLYKRPLESLLATWGVSLVLQQTFRALFGSANVQVNSPGWLSGSFVISDVLLAYNRLFVIFFALLILLGTYLLLTRTSLGLQIRAVMQNRPMASALGVSTDRVNMLTFGLGSGLAGMAGACLSQIANVGPSLGQNYIIDCFMVVVLGGVGNLVGTVTAAAGIGVTDQILQPWLGAVMGKITVLAAIILFLQWRPAGLFAVRGRGLED